LALFISVYALILPTAVVSPQPASQSEVMCSSQTGIFVAPDSIGVCACIWEWIMHASMSWLKELCPAIRAGQAATKNR